MPANDAMQVLTAAVTPVVLVSATAILISGINSRYIAISDRMRALAHKFRDADCTAECQAAIADRRGTLQANLVIAGAIPHAEDSWPNLQIGSVRLGIVKPCARCSTVLVDPITANVGVEPLRTLAEYRRMPQSVMFGQNALVVTPGQLRVGSAVETTTGPSTGQRVGRLRIRLATS